MEIEVFWTVMPCKLLVALSVDVDGRGDAYSGHGDGHDDGEEDGHAECEISHDEVYDGLGDFGHGDDGRFDHNF
jgi:hypothetical protein